MPQHTHPFPTRRSSDLSKITMPAFGCATWQDDEIGSRPTWTLWPRLNPTRTWVVAANGYHGGECVNSTRILNQLVRFFDRYVRSEEHTSELQSPDHLVCPNIHTLSLHDALPISARSPCRRSAAQLGRTMRSAAAQPGPCGPG